jgi:hypothetical protein
MSLFCMYSDVHMLHFFVMLRVVACWFSEKCLLDMKLMELSECFSVLTGSL